MVWLTAAETVSSTVLTATDRLSAQLGMQERQVGHAAGSWQPEAAEQHAPLVGEAVRTAVSPPDRRPATVMWRPERALARPSSMGGLVPEAAVGDAPRAAPAPEQPVCTAPGRQLDLRAGHTALTVSLPAA